VGFLSNIVSKASTFFNNIPTKQEWDAPETRWLEYEGKGWDELRAQMGSGDGSGAKYKPLVNAHKAINSYVSLVYDCVSLISRKVTTIPFYLYEKHSKKNKEEFDKLFDHPVIELLEKPNKFLSGRQFKEIIQIHLDLCGFAIVRVLFNRAGQPGELHIMEPTELNRIELGKNNDDLIKGFHFHPEQSRTQNLYLPYEQVLYFHYPHPRNPYLYFPPLEAIAHVTEMDLFLQIYEKAFFLNNARPDYLIIPKSHLSRGNAERVSEGFMARHRGVGKAFKPAVMSEDITFQQLSMSARDFEFQALAQWVRSMILMCYAIPESMLGQMGDTNRATSLNAESVFIDNCISKRLHLFEDVINMQLLPLFKGTGGYLFEHSSAKPKDAEWDLAKNTGELTNGLKSIDEIRRENGEAAWDSPLTKVPWQNGQPIPGVSAEADKLWKESQAPPQPAPGSIDPTTGQPIPAAPSNDPNAQGEMGVLGGRPTGTSLNTLLNSALRTSRPSLSSLLNAARNKRGGLRALIDTHKENFGSFEAQLAPERSDLSLAKLIRRGIYDYIGSEFVAPEEQWIFKIYEDLIIPEWLESEEKLTETTANFLITKGVQIANIVEKSFSEITIKGSESVEDIDIEDFRADYKKSASSLIFKGVDIGYRAGFEMVRKTHGDVRQGNSFEPAALDAAGKFLDKSADLRVASTKKALIKMIQEGITRGLGSDDVAQLIAKKFKDISSARAMMIARTEISGAVNEGISRSFEQINEEAGRVVIKESKLWTSLDERTCEECEHEHNHIVKNYETGEVFLVLPLHPNCRCSTIPVT
jgi:HK97 family phage portal protein